MRSWLYTIVVVAVLAACTTVPEQLKGTYTAVSPSRVEPAVFGTTVRWGGVIIDAANAEDQTCFEILSRDLDKFLRPKQEDRTGGRFIACKAGFYDPEVFAAGREVTLVGRIRDVEVRHIGAFDYRYPIVDLEELVLWEVREEVLVVDNVHGAYGYPYHWHGPYWGYYPYYWPGWPMHHRTYVRTRRLLPDPADVPDSR